MPRPTAAGPPAFEALQVLELQDCADLSALPPALGRMRALRWLRLSTLGLWRLELPGSLGALQHLGLGALPQVGGPGAWLGLHGTCTLCWMLLLLGLFIDAPLLCV